MSFMEPLTEQGAIGEPRQFVVVGQVAHPLFGFAAGRQISEETHNMTDVSSRIAHHVQL
ncbi:hypothetical protein D3C86_1896090 [compost metagenome]